MVTLKIFQLVQEMIGWLQDYPYFKENYKMIAIDLSKQEAIDADSKIIQKIDFT